jgi:hypothetical protein
MLLRCFVQWFSSARMVRFHQPGLWKKHAANLTYVSTPRRTQLTPALLSATGPNASIIGTWEQLYLIVGVKCCHSYCPWIDNIVSIKCLPPCEPTECALRTTCCYWFLIYPNIATSITEDKMDRLMLHEEGSKIVGFASRCTWWMRLTKQPGIH